MTMQMRRASVSISLNIAEGTSRSSAKDQAHFFEIAYGSLNEVVANAHVARRQGYLSEEQLATVRSDAARLCRMLSGLRRSVIGRAQ